MNVTPEQLKILMGNLNPSRVSKRKQGNRELSYLEAFDVKATLTRIFGFGGFSAEVIDTTIVRMEKDAPAYTGYGDKRKPKVNDAGEPEFNWNVTAMCTLRLTIHSTINAVFTETAAASQTGPDVGEVTDFAIKTAESDALKRAAIYLGTQFGLSLYADGSTSEVVKVIVAPGQEWPNEAVKAETKKLNAAKTTAEAKKALEESLGAKEIEPNADHTETVQG